MTGQSQPELQLAAQVIDQQTCPIGALPTELLAEVFLDTVTGSKSRWRRMRALTHVCRQWRKVVLELTSLWQHLELHSGWPYEACQELVRRSGRRSLQVDITFNPLATMQFPTSELDRVECVRLLCRRNFIVGPGPAMYYGLPALRELHIRYATFSPPPSVPFLSPIHPLNFLEVLHATMVPYESFTAYFRPTLKTLYVERLLGPTDWDIPIELILHALTALPLLEVLHISHFFRPSDVGLRHHLPAVHLPHLKTFYLSSDAAVCADFLDRVTFPIQVTPGGSSGKILEVVGVNGMHHDAAETLHELAEFVAAKLAGIGIIGAAPPIDSLKICVHPCPHRPLIVEFGGDAKTIVSWDFIYDTEFYEFEVRDFVNAVLGSIPPPFSQGYEHCSSPMMELS